MHLSCESQRNESSQDYESQGINSIKHCMRSILNSVAIKPNFYDPRHIKPLEYKVKLVSSLQKFNHSYKSIFETIILSKRHLIDVSMLENKADISVMKV